MSESTVVKVRQHGVVTIPDGIREVLKIEVGDYVRITVEKVDLQWIQSAKAQAQEQEDTQEKAHTGYHYTGKR